MKQDLTYAKFQVDEYTFVETILDTLVDVEFEYRGEIKFKFICSENDATIRRHL